MSRFTRTEWLHTIPPSKVSRYLKRKTKSWGIKNKRLKDQKKKKILKKREKKKTHPLIHVREESHTHTLKTKQTRQILRVNQASGWKNECMSDPFFKLSLKQLLTRNTYTLFSTGEITEAILPWPSLLQEEEKKTILQSDKAREGAEGAKGSWGQRAKEKKVVRVQRNSTMSSLGDHAWGSTLLALALWIVSVSRQK